VVLGVLKSRETDTNSWQVGNEGWLGCYILWMLDKRKGAPHMQAIIIYGMKAKHNGGLPFETKPKTEKRNVHQG